MPHIVSVYSTTKGTTRGPRKEGATVCGTRQGVYGNYSVVAVHAVDGIGGGMCGLSSLLPAFRSFAKIPGRSGSDGLINGQNSCVALRLCAVCIIEIRGDHERLRMCGASVFSSRSFRVCSLNPCSRRAYSSGIQILFRYSYGQSRQIYRGFTVRIPVRWRHLFRLCMARQRRDIRDTG